MAKQASTPNSADATAPDPEAHLLRAGLDTLTFGFAIFDHALKLVASNRAFRTSARVSIGAVQARNGACGILSLQRGTRRLRTRQCGGTGPDAPESRPRTQAALT